MMHVYFAIASLYLLALPFARPKIMQIVCLAAVVGWASAGLLEWLS